MPTTRQYNVARLEAALVIAKEQGNTRLVNTLTPMILQERVKQNNNTDLTESIVGQAVRTARPVYNPRRASIKLKAELHDTRIDLESPEVISERLAQFNRKRQVFQRG